ncbi:MAG TPA: hypothetical protein VMF11_03500 [Candidatus Baltobacteraceae bacterium]|nr:hypothetical protein [Candidatus Baltobacteraceae bacterium]
MLGAHVVLHLGLCHAMLNLPPETAITAHVRVIDRIGRPHLDQNMSFLRNYENTGVVQFDVPFGLYALQVSVPRYGCYAQDFFFIINGHDRTMTEQLTDGAPAATYPMLMDGTAPASFIYLSPTYVLFDKDTQCNKPVGDPIQVQTKIEDDQDSFYVWMYPDASLVARGQETIAMQIQTPTGDYHYVRIKAPFPVPWHGWPINIQFTLNEGAIDFISTQPTGVLLCPKIYETSSG